MGKNIFMFDSTLRDGAQGEGISFSVKDKLKIVKSLDDLGIEYIEAGNPGSNPKDLEFFEKVKELELKHSKIVAFGSTRRKGIKACEDANLQSLIKAGTSCCVIFGKSWDFHVTDIINATLEENIEMIEDTIKYLISMNKDVIFDAEHFFDGYKNNKEYAMKTLEIALKAGSLGITLCDTNGGTFPMEIYNITKDVCETFSEYSPIVGIHCHNDCGVAVADSITAVDAGATMVQGTFIGIGERCGNANLSTVIGGLQIKKGYDCIPQELMHNLTKTARFVAEVANVRLKTTEPFVGKSAFAHKGGMHIDAVVKNPHSFEHISPEIVGNRRKTLTSEVAGRSTILKKIQRISPHIDKNSQETEEIMAHLKALEHDGFQFEAADASFELMIRKHLGKHKTFFELVKMKLICEQPYEGFSASAIIKVLVEGKEEITAAEGQGPINALDKALRKALEVFYPSLSHVYLTDYKVRVLDSKSATASKVRVLIESSDGAEVWSTIGVSEDIIEASFEALVDSIDYKLTMDSGL